jgi:hypothetical protein
VKGAAAMSSTAPVDRQKFAIGVLSVTACVLLVGWLLLAFSPPAHAIGQSDRGGDYVLLTQQISTSQEGVVVVDAASKRMVMYAFDFNNKNLVLLDGFDLGGLRGATAEEPGQADREIRRERRNKP